MPPKKDLDIEQLKTLYEKFGSIAKVSKIVGAGAETVRLRLVDVGVELRKRGRPVAGKEKIDGAERVRQHREKKKRSTKE